MAVGQGSFLGLQGSGNDGGRQERERAAREVTTLLRRKRHCLALGGADFQQALDYRFTTGPHRVTTLQHRFSHLKETSHIVCLRHCYQTLSPPTMKLSIPVVWPHLSGAGREGAPTSLSRPEAFNIPVVQCRADCPWSVHYFTLPSSGVSQELTKVWDLSRFHTPGFIARIPSSYLTLYRPGRPEINTRDRGHATSAQSQGTTQTTCWPRLQRPKQRG